MRDIQNTFILCGRVVCEIKVMWSFGTRFEQPSFGRLPLHITILILAKGYVRNSLHLSFLGGGLGRERDCVLQPWVLRFGKIYVSAFIISNLFDST